MVVFLSVETILSVCVLIFSLVYVLGFYRKTANGKHFTPLWLFTAGFFISVLLFLIPLHYIGYDKENNLLVWLDPSSRESIVTPALTSLLNTLQVFINDGSTETFENAADHAIGFTGLWKQLYTIYAAVLIVGAPILTFGSVLSLIEGVADEIKYAFKSLTGKKRFYIMSQLNNGSITLARDVLENVKDSDENNKTLPGKIIVFTDVDNDVDSELISQAKEIKAVILKRSISELNVSRLKYAELFLIGNDENENVSRALAITKTLNDLKTKKIGSQKIRIFAFAHSRANGCVIDSAEYEELMSDKPITEDNISNSTYPEPDFRLRRVDIIRQFVWNEVQKMGFFEGDCGRPISILIVGLGSYGLEFFKTMSWFCYFYKRTLEINIVDKKQNVSSIVERHCPGLLTVSKINPHYSVECFSDIDLETSDFKKLLNESSRLKKTTHVIVSMGDDNTNTEAAIYLRELFDRADPPKDGVPPKSEKDEKTHIYALLYDDYPDFEDSPRNKRLINHKRVSYNINFIGGLGSKFTHKVVYDDKFEMDSFENHVEWVRKNLNGKSFEQQRQEFKAEERAYEQYEYLRLSSMAQEIYKRALKKRFTDISDDELTVNEHNRWNLYMHSLGYVYDKLRSDRAKTHYDLIRYEELSENEKLKNQYSDSTNNDNGGE